MSFWLNLIFIFVSTSLDELKITLQSPSPVFRTLENTSEENTRVPNTNDKYNMIKNKIQFGRGAPLENNNTIPLMGGD